MNPRIFIALVLFFAAVWPPYTLFSVWCAANLAFVVGVNYGRVTERRETYTVFVEGERE